MTDDVLSLLKRRVNEAAKLGTQYAFPACHDVQRPIGSVKKAHSAAGRRANIKRHLRLYDLRLRDAGSGFGHGFANAQFITGTCEYSDDHALRSSCGRTATDCDGEGREISR
jgi:hypothetical protein